MTFSKASSQGILAESIWSDALVDASFDAAQSAFTRSGLRDWAAASNEKLNEALQCTIVHVPSKQRTRQTPWEMCLWGWNWRMREHADHCFGANSALPGRENQLNLAALRVLNLSWGEMCVLIKEGFAQKPSSEIEEATQWLERTFMQRARAKDARPRWTMREMRGIAQVGKHAREKAAHCDMWLIAALGRHPEIARRDPRRWAGIAARIEAGAQERPSRAAEECATASLEKWRWSGVTPPLRAIWHCAREATQLTTEAAFAAGIEAESEATGIAREKRSSGTGNGPLRRDVIVEAQMSFETRMEQRCEEHALTLLYALIGGDMGLARAVLDGIEERWSAEASLRRLGRGKKGRRTGGKLDFTNNTGMGWTLGLWTPARVLCAVAMTHGATGSGISSRNPLWEVAKDKLRNHSAVVTSIGPDAFTRTPERRGRENASVNAMANAIERIIYDEVPPPQPRMKGWLEWAPGNCAAKRHIAVHGPPKMPARRGEEQATTV